MAHATNTASYTRSMTGDRATTLLALLRTRWAQYSIYRRTVRELGDLPDRELADLGLTRASIRHVAHEAAYGK